jgi:hypothetical protein
MAKSRSRFFIACWARENGTPYFMVAIERQPGMRDKVEVPRHSRRRSLRV